MSLDEFSLFISSLSTEDSQIRRHGSLPCWTKPPQPGDMAYFETYGRDLFIHVHWREGVATYSGSDFVRMPCGPWSEAD